MTHIRIEAEDYKQGGEGVAYHDTTSGNSGGQYRSDNVDIETTQDAGGGYNIGWTIAGEWLTYDVEIPEAGDYQIVGRVAARKSGLFNFDTTIDGQTANFSFSGTGGWQSWQDTTAEVVTLSAGSHELRLDINTRNFNINYLELIPVDNTPNPSPTPEPGTLSFSDTTYSINEDGTTTAAVTVTRSAGSNGAVSVKLTPSNGTATADDYDNTAITVDLANGETEKTVNIPIIDDTDIEGDETINLVLSDPTGGATIGTQDTAVLTIVDNDGSIRIEAEDYKQGGEGVAYHDTTSGNSGKKYRSDNVDIETTRDAGGGYNIGWTIAGEWLTYDVEIPEAGDYQIVGRVASNESGPFNFDTIIDGQTANFSFSGTGSWQSWQDTTAEVVTLSAGSHELRLDINSNYFNINYLELIPVDNTPNPSPTPEAGTLSFSDTTYSINEDGTTTTAVTVTRSAGSDGAVSITLTPSNGTATADDYDNTPITVDFADGETQKTVNIPITDDSQAEGDETINLALSNPTGGATLGTQDTAVLTVIDNDNENPTAINGTEAGETLTGDEEDNDINGFGGNDTLNGSGGDDNLFGGSGNNTYNGNDGNDTVSYANNQTSGVIANLNTGNVSRKFETWSQDFKIMPLGDSNTTGVPLKSTNGGYREELWRFLNDAGYNIDFVGTALSGNSSMDRNHEGRSGFTINNLIDNTVTKIKGSNKPTVATYTTIEDTLGTHNPDMVLLMAGTNDINKDNDDADTAIADLEELVNRIVTATPDTHVLVASVIPNISSSSREARTIEFSGRIENEIVQPQANAGNNVSFVDVFNAPLVASNLSSDGFHLTSTGYDELAKVWEDAILNTVVAEDTLINVENVIGSDGNDELIGNNGANELTGGAGDDTLTGGGGNDIFIYSQGDGTDTITDFGAGNDIFGLSGGLTFNELTIETVGSNTEVKVTNTAEVLAVLEGVVANDITSADFITV